MCETLFFQIFSSFLVVQFLIFSNCVSTVQVGYINDVILSSSTSTVVQINDSCVKCICMMLLASNILGVSCSQNETCFIFYNYSLSYVLIESPNSSFHFLSLPPEQTYSTYESIQQQQLSEF
jgi:hypothetical protein